MEMRRLADPLRNGTSAEMGASPSKNVTEPVDPMGVTRAVNVSGAPKTEGLAPTVKLSEVDVAVRDFTVWDKTGEMASLKSASPLYWTVMACVPAARKLVEKLAVPVASGKALLMAVLPSKNTTLPVAAGGAMLAVNVMVSPTKDGLEPAVRVRLTVALLFRIVSVKAELTAGENRLLPV